MNTLHPLTTTIKIMIITFRNLCIALLLVTCPGLIFKPNEPCASVPTPNLHSIQSFLAGGSGNDYLSKMVLLDENHLLIAGNTTSDRWQNAQNIIKIGKAKKSNVYIALVSLPRLEITRLLMIGGSDNDFLDAMTRGPSGEIYLCGNTFSKDFPSENTLGTPHTNDKNDAFLLKLPPDLTTILKSITFGGKDYDYPSVMAINSDHIYVGGNTASVDFPMPPDASKDKLNTKPPGNKNSYGFDAFIIAFDSALTSANCATFLGGEEDEFIRAMQFSEDGKLVASGFTLSSDFYRSKGIKATPSSSFGLSAFITVLNPNLSQITDSLILGTTNHLYVRDLAIDPDGSFWITGYCTDGNLPTTSNVIAKRYGGGGYDSFIVHISKDMQSIEAATYLGGSNNEFAQKILVTPQGNVLIGGFTDSFHDFPISHNLNKTLNLGHFDIFTTELSRDLTTVHFSLLNGGSGYDYLYDMILSEGIIYLAGNSTSVKFDTMERNKTFPKNKLNNVYFQTTTLTDLR